MSRIEQSGRSSLRRPKLPTKVGTVLKEEEEKVKGSRYRPGVAQRVGGGIAPLFNGRGARRG